MPIAALLARALGRPVPPTPSVEPPSVMAAVSGPESGRVAAPATLPAPRRRRLTPAGWRRVLIDTGVLHYVRRDSRRDARFAVLAKAAGLSVDDFMREVEARYAQALRRDDYGRRPMEVHDFAARLHALGSADPDAAARLADVHLRGIEAERRADVAHRRRKVAEKAVAARGLAAVLAAAALVGQTVEVPADPAPPPVV